MTITAAISNALSALQANARSAGTVSNNLANVATEGFSRRDVELDARAMGGVRVLGVARAEDLRLSADLRRATGDGAAAGLASDALRRIERALGVPGEPGSLSVRLGELETALLGAAADPAAEVRLIAAQDALADLVRGLNDASSAVEAARTEAEAGVDGDVDALNGHLGRIADLNGRISKGQALGRDVNALLDQRRGEVDAVGRIAPVRMFERQDGMVTLIAEGGATLIDGLAVAEIEFSAAGLVTAEMDAAAGSLGRVEFRGKPIDPGAPGAALSGGTLGAHLKLRDETLPAIQARLDAVAVDLRERLGPPSPDADVAASGTGLLVDRGPSPSGAPDVGLAGRLGLAAGIDPAQNGEAWRLRDGLAAAAPGPSGDGALLRGLASALSTPRAAPAGFSPGQRDVAGLVADVVSGVSAGRLAAEARGARAGAVEDVLRQQQAARGVDTDLELQKLMDIERNYAASARVIETVDAMLDQLMRI